MLVVVAAAEDGGDAAKGADLVLQGAVLPHEGGEDEDAEFFEVAPFEFGGLVVDGRGGCC